METTKTQPADDWRWHPVRRPSDDTFFGWGVQKAFRGNASLTNDGTDYLDQFVGMEIPVRRDDGKRNDRVAGPLIEVTWYQDGAVATYAVEGETRLPPGGVVEIDRRGEPTPPPPEPAPPRPPAGTEQQMSLVGGLFNQAAKPPTNPRPGHKRPGPTAAQHDIAAMQAATDALERHFGDLTASKDPMARRAAQNGIAQAAIDYNRGEWNYTATELAGAAGRKERVRAREEMKRSREAIKRTQRYCANPANALDEEDGERLVKLGRAMAGILKRLMQRLRRWLSKGSDGPEVAAEAGGHEGPGGP